MSFNIFSIGVMIGRNSDCFVGVKMLRDWAWHLISIVSAIVTGSPSMWAGPSSFRYITAAGARNVWIIVLLLMYPVKRSTPTRAVSRSSGMYNGYVKESVGYACVRSDIGVIAIL